MYESELTLDRIGFPPFSARNCQQTLIPVISGDLRRTVNGTLIYTGNEGHHKFQTAIQCQDKSCPAFEGIWRGSLVKVGCIQRLSQEVKYLREITLYRDPMENSVIVMDENRQEKEIESVTERIVRIRDWQPEPDKWYVFYRPSLAMRVISYKLLTDEWGFSGGWQLDLEEV
jgi:hypothetical protein